MKCGNCGKKLHWIRIPWRTHYTIKVLDDDWRLVESFPACTKCGKVYNEIEKLVSELGLQKVKEILNEMR